MEKLNIDQVHQRLLGIAKELDRICVSHRIPYYMIGGTMLGAIRHKGFIPWDDDMDFGIPREYFEMFIQICHQELKYPYQLRNYKNSVYGIAFYKIEDCTTLVDDPCIIQGKESSIGINIDVFPLERCFAQSDNFICCFKKKEVLSRLKQLLFYESTKPTLSKSFLRFVSRKLLFFLTEKAMIEKIDEIARSVNNRGGDSLVNFYGIYKKKEIIPLKIWGEPKKYIFEDTKLMGVSDYDCFLTHLYGDYMQLPPKEKRHIHCNNIYVK